MKLVMLLLLGLHTATALLLPTAARLRPSPAATSTPQALKMSLDRRSALSVLAALPAVLVLPASPAFAATDKVVIFGGSGYVGAHAAQMLLGQGAQVVSVSRKTAADAVPLPVPLPVPRPASTPAPNRPEPLLIPLPLPGSRPYPCPCPTQCAKADKVKAILGTGLTLDYISLDASSADLSGGCHVLFTPMITPTARPLHSPCRPVRMAFTCSHDRRASGRHRCDLVRGHCPRRCQPARR